MSSDTQNLSKEEKQTRIEYLKEAIERFSNKRELFLEKVFSVLDEALRCLDPEWTESEEVAKKDSTDRFSHRIHNLEVLIEKPCEALQYDAEVLADGEKIEKVQSEWEAERSKLLATYDQLIKVHREQNFHLQRGTHLRKTVTYTNEDLVERKLSADSTRLAKEINFIQDKLRDTKDEVYKRKAEYLDTKKQHENQKENFDKVRNQQESKVYESETEHRELYKEHMILQKLRLDLGDLLTSLRDGFDADM